MVRKIKICKIIYLEINGFTLRRHTAILPVALPLPRNGSTSDIFLLQRRSGDIQVDLSRHVPVRFSGAETA